MPSSEEILGMFMQLLRDGLAMTDDGVPVMSDAEFDRRVAELDALKPTKETP